MSSQATRLIAAAKHLRAAVGSLRFELPVTHVYNPLDYAWPAHEVYLRKYGTGKKRVLFLGMNPGPFGMAQTGIPFGEIKAVRNWLGIDAPIAKPACEHPERPVLGFRCHRSEVSGQRLWKLFAARFSGAADFFRDHFVVNYCPLAFFEESGRNRTPDKLPIAEQEPLTAACDAHLRRVIELLEPEWLIAIGRFAEERARSALADRELKMGCMLHPSPANPQANGDWQGAALSQLRELGVW